MTRSELINLIIKKSNYKSYLEVGVNIPEAPGWNFGTINAEIKNSVDPEKKARATYLMTSDEFFDKTIKIKYDVIFIDGLHIFEQAYRDITNSLKWLNENGTIIVHDCNPVLEITQRRKRASETWHGDVWKAILKLRMEEPDVTIYTVDTDQGCTVIQKGVQKLFKTDDSTIDIYNFNFFDLNRKNILNLISIRQFKKILGAENAFVTRGRYLRNSLFYKVKRMLINRTQHLFKR